MKQTKQKIGKRNRRATGLSAGMTLLELIVACGILVTMAGMAVPMARVTIKRQREAVLRYDLREMRDAIDRYKDAADHNLIRVEVGTEGYPPDLQTLVDGVDLAGAPDRHVRFLRSIPLDPMTGTKDWGMRSVQDDPDADSWGGQDVFDVFTRSQGVALDGTNYKDW
ncbi:MAG TPA: type II secretion system protein [Candidatus Acidoferrales bacterium]|nr:type II secretion system protein [Candidatus Acidoferrales bacterium]